MGNGTRHKKGKKYRAGQYGQDGDWLNTQASFGDWLDSEGYSIPGQVDVDGGDDADYRGGAGTKDVQGFFVQQGYNLGNSGANRDGVDGDFGEKSKAAWNSYHEYVEQNFQDGIYENHAWTKTGTEWWGNPSEDQRKAVRAVLAKDGAVAVGDDEATAWANNSAWWNINQEKLGGTVDQWLAQVMVLDEKARQEGYENFRDMVLKNREAAAALQLQQQLQGQDEAILKSIVEEELSLIHI